MAGWLKGLVKWLDEMKCMNGMDLGNTKWTIQGSVEIFVWIFSLEFYCMYSFIQSNLHMMYVV